MGIGCKGSRLIPTDRERRAGVRSVQAEWPERDVHAVGAAGARALRRRESPSSRSSSTPRRCSRSSASHRSSNPKTTSARPTNASSCFSSAETWCRRRSQPSRPARSRRRASPSMAAASGTSACASQTMPRIPARAIATTCAASDAPSIDVPVLRTAGVGPVVAIAPEKTTRKPETHRDEFPRAPRLNR